MTPRRDPSPDNLLSPCDVIGIDRSPEWRGADSSHPGSIWLAILVLIFFGLVAMAGLWIVAAVVEFAQGGAR